MKLTILTTVTNPIKRQDPFYEAIYNYLDVADEVVIVNGGGQADLLELSHWLFFEKGLGEIDQNRIKVVNLPWAYDWDWKELPLHLNAGLKVATGDWILKLDIDQFIHESIISILKERLEAIKEPVASMQKYNVLPNKRYLEKGEVVIAIKGSMVGKILFGATEGKYTDLCLPVKVTKNEDVPIGTEITQIGRTGLPIWNFPYFFKDKEFTKKEFLRFSLAHKRHFGTTSWGQTEDEALEVFIKDAKGRLEKSQYEVINVNILPKYIIQRYSKLTPSEFGFNGWGLL
jgi:hypothetical protein